MLMRVCGNVFGQFDGCEKKSFDINPFDLPKLTTSLEHDVFSIVHGVISNFTSR